MYVTSMPTDISHGKEKLPKKRAEVKGRHSWNERHVSFVKIKYEGLTIPKEETAARATVKKSVTLVSGPREDSHASNVPAIISMKSGTYYIILLPLFFASLLIVINNNTNNNTTQTYNSWKCNRW